MTVECVPCPRCGQDHLRDVRLVFLERDAVFCTECDALWVGRPPAFPGFDDYSTYMEQHGRVNPGDRSELAIRGLWAPGARVRTVLPIAAVVGLDVYSPSESVVELRGPSGNLFHAFCDGEALTIGDVLSTYVLDSLAIENDFEDIVATGREPLGIETTGEWDAIVHGRVVDLHDAEMLVDAGDALVVVDGLTHDPRVIGSLVRLVLTRVEIVPQSLFPDLFERPGARWKQDRDASFAHFLASAGTDAGAVARWRGRVLGPTIPREQVERFLGPPSVDGERAFGYRLAAYPRHVYTFELDEHGHQQRVGFRRIGEPVADPPAPDDPLARAAYVRALAEQEGTEDELLRGLGAPLDRIGWWPCETLCFAGGLLVEQRHGIVQEPPSARPQVADPGVVS